MISSVLMKMSSVHENLPECGHWANQKKEGSCLDERIWSLGKSPIRKDHICHVGGVSLSIQWGLKGKRTCDGPRSNVFHGDSLLKCFPEWLLNHWRNKPANPKRRMSCPSETLFLFLFMFGPAQFLSCVIPGNCLGFIPTLSDANPQDSKNPRIRWAV